MKIRCSSNKGCQNVVHFHRSLSIPVQMKGNICFLPKKGCQNVVHFHRSLLVPVQMEEKDENDVKTSCTFTVPFSSPFKKKSFLFVETWDLIPVPAWARARLGGLIIDYCDMYNPLFISHSGRGGIFRGASGGPTTTTLDSNLKYP